jgi:two-component system sensor kinase FixL
LESNRPAVTLDSSICHIAPSDTETSGNVDESLQAPLEHGDAAIDPQLRNVAARRARAVQTVFLGAIYVVIYIFLEWISSAEQPFVNYSWNPNSGASIAVALILGRRMIPFMFIAPLLDEFFYDLLFRQIPVSLHLELATAALIGTVYSAAALFLLHPNQRFDPTLQSMRSLFLLTITTAVSTGLVAAGYAGIVVAAGVLSAADYTGAALSYWVGDVIGIIVLTPLALALWTRRYAVWMSVETLLQLGAILIALVLVHVNWTAQHLQFFYILFVPIVWMAVRSGIEGVCVGILVVQLGFVSGFHIFPDEVSEMPKIQALMIVLALTGLFAGELVTERRRAETALRLHQESLAQLARLGSVGELAAAVAHELNQPLTAAGTYTRLVDEAISSGNANSGTVAETAKKAAAQVERAAEVVKRLRALVRLDRSNRVVCGVDSIVRETVDLVRPELDRLGVNVQQSLAAGLPLVMVDVLQIEQALLNLVRNSIDAIGEAGHKTIAIEAAPAGAEFVEVRVRDSGPGFPPDRAANPFLPLSSTKKEGLGIGLPLSRSLIEAHGGRMWLDTDLPGAAIHFTLPVAKASSRA